MDASPPSLAACIEFMAAKVRAAALGPAPDREAPAPGFWVLLVGEALDPDSLPARDAARAALRQSAADRGLPVRECVWVWDHTGRAQLLAGEFPSRSQAEALAVALLEGGAEVRVIPAFPPDTQDA